MVAPITQTQKPIFNAEDTHQLNLNADTVKKDTQSQRDPLSNPSDNLPKTTQVSSDILIGSHIGTTIETPHAEIDQKTLE